MDQHQAEALWNFLGGDIDGFKSLCLLVTGSTANQARVEMSADSPDS